MNEKIIGAIAAQLNLDPANVKPEMRLVEDLKADSLDVVALIMELEQEFDIQISDDEMMTLRTVEDIINYLKDKI